MSEYTKEPWYVTGLREIHAEDHRVIAVILYESQDKEVFCGKEEDARRIVACVNACAGIPTEKLEGNTIAEYVSSEAYIKGMGVNNGSLEIDINGLPCSILAASFAGQFVGSGAVNFLTIDMHHKSIGEFTITMQRSGGTTSADKLKELKNQRDELLSALDTLCNGLEWNIENNPTAMNECDCEALESARAAIAKINVKAGK